MLGVSVIGNLGELLLLLKGLHDMGRTAIQADGLVTGILRTIDGLRALLSGERALSFRTEWWYWNATRVIDHPQGEAGPITEFPYFTFLYSDLHAHMMALPYTFVCLALILAVLRTSYSPQITRRPPLAFGFPWLAWLLIALVVGALWPLNTWDFPTFAALAAVALALRSLSRGLSVGALMRAGIQWIVLVGLSYALFLPFHRSYATAYSSVELWNGSRTTFYAYLTIHGIFLFVIVTGLIMRIFGPSTRAPLAREIRLLIHQAYRFGHLRSLDRRLVHRTPQQHLGLMLVAAIFLLAVAILALKMVSPSFPLVVLSVPLFVLALTTVLFFDRHNDALEQFTLICIALGAALTMVVEVIVLKGDISRMNTVFKFYLQVWTLWALATAIWIPRILQGGPNRAATVGTGVIRLAAPPGWWRPAFAALVLSGMLYPVFATYGRARDRFENSTRVTIDGMAYMDTAKYNDKDQAMILKWDREAIDWLLEHVQGSPVIVEAVTPLYHWGSRVSVYTGLPTVIGWDWHQKQQRSVLPGDVVDRRINDVSQIFGAASTDRTRELLDRYGVRYLYVGDQERLYYPGVDEKMRRNQGNLWNRVYENQEVSIYEVRG
jgi:YYY domain-containing protein